MFWKIVLGIALFIIMLLFLPIRLSISYAADGNFCFSLRIIGIPLFRWPEKKPLFRPRRYSASAIARRERKERRHQQKEEKRAARKAQKKQTKKADSSEIPEKKAASLPSQITSIASLVTDTIKRTLGHVRWDIDRLFVAVASPDAAKTALLYGAVSSAIAFLLEALNQSSHLHFHRSERMGVVADFGQERSHVDIRISATLRIWHLLDIGIHAILRMLRLQPSPKKSHKIASTDQSAPD